jgi:hypothetical protein
MADRADDPLVGTTYEPTLALAGPRRLGFVRPLAGACIVVCLGVSLGFGVLAVRNLSKPEPPPLYAMSSLTVPVEIAAPAPTPEPGPAFAPLEVLPDEMARAAAARPVIQTAAPIASEPPRRADPGFSCRRPDTPTARLVCGDTELTRLHRGMARAFDEAVATGVPYDSLRLDQDDWLRVREDAARYEPDGVAGMYRQRIAELKDMAASF